jgi:hypothetical protein
MWGTIDSAIVKCGYQSLYSKFKVPGIIVLWFAYILQLIGKILNR